MINATDPFNALHATHPTRFVPQSRHSNRIIGSFERGYNRQ